MSIFILCLPVRGVLASVGNAKISETTFPSSYLNGTSRNPIPFQWHRKYTLSSDIIFVGFQLKIWYIFRYTLFFASIYSKLQVYVINKAFAAYGFLLINRSENPYVRKAESFAAVRLFVFHFFSFRLIPAWFLFHVRKFIRSSVISFFFSIISYVTC